MAASQVPLKHKWIVMTPRTISAVALIFSCINAWAGEIQCVQPPKSSVTDFIADAQGKAGALGGKVVKGEISGGVSVIAKDFLKEYPNADKLNLAHALINMSCEVIRTSSLTSQEKIDELRDVRKSVTFLLTGAAMPAAQPVGSSVDLVPKYEGKYFLFLNQGGRVFNQDMSVVARNTVTRLATSDCPGVGKQATYVTAGHSPYGYDVNDEKVAFRYYAGNTPDVLSAVATNVASQLKIPRRCIQIAEKTYLKLRFDNPGGQTLTRHYVIFSDDNSALASQNIQLSPAVVFDETEVQLNSLRKEGKFTTLYPNNIVVHLRQ